MVILQALRAVLGGAPVPKGGVPNDETQATAEPEGGASGREIEIMFFFRSTAAHRDELRGYLAEHGNSVMLSPVDESCAKVHVHTDQAGPVIERVFALGEVSDLRLEVLPGVPEEPGHCVVALVHSGRSQLAELFHAVGAIALEVGEQLCGTPRPTGVILVTNGLQADPAQITGALGISEEVPMFVVAAGSYVSGLAALAVYDADDPGATRTVADMEEAAAAQRWGTLDPGECTPARARELVAQLLSDGSGEMLTALWAPPLTESDLAELGSWVRATWPDIEWHAYPAEGMAEALQVGVE
ncbi:hypothetical protein DLJ54_03875 [Corynebacterium heidelbergense]|uniref:Fatty acid kinase subunit A-like C-terminal domain-containing protein n=1 Tax=Corynebacterium heidelbergense TaxID=2055947 RepID=A0A364V6R5_9CORY|nr:hypothetical protein DLJ54_03875 [Corynebacterium heidelbergense]